MAIAYDATSKGAAATPLTLTVSHTCTGSNLLLTASVLWFDSAAKTLSGVTYNGVAMTLGTSNASGNYKHSMWYLINPATGTHDIVATWSGAINDNATLIGASYTGAKQSSQPDATATDSSASGTILTTNITTVADSCMLVDSFADIDNTGAPTAGASQNERNTQASGNGFLDAVSDKLVGTAGVQSMAYTKNGAAGRLLHLILSLAPAAGGAGNTSRLLSSLNAGS